MTVNEKKESGSKSALVAAKSVATKKASAVTKPPLKKAAPTTRAKPKPSTATAAVKKPQVKKSSVTRVAPRSKAQSSESSMSISRRVWPD